MSKSQAARCQPRTPRVETFLLPDVLRAIGIAGGTAENWGRRGKHPCAALLSGRGRGRVRSVDAETVKAWAVMAALAEWGIPPGTSSQLLADHAGGFIKLQRVGALLTIDPETLAAAPLAALRGELA